MYMMEAVGFSEVLVPAYSLHIISYWEIYVTIHSHEDLKFCVLSVALGGAMKNCEECQDSGFHPEIYTGLIPNTSQKHYFCC